MTEDSRQNNRYYGFSLRAKVSLEETDESKTFKPKELESKEKKNNLIVEQDSITLVKLERRRRID